MGNFVRTIVVVIIGFGCSVAAEAMSHSLPTVAAGKSAAALGDTPLSAARARRERKPTAAPAANLSPATPAVPPNPPIRWMAYYGNRLTADALQYIDLAILESAHIQPKVFPKTTKTVFIGYVSVGEADSTRPYWERVKDQPFVIEANPEWPNAYRVDIRAAEWRTLLLEEIIPQLVEQGYQGVFLDTIDTANYLEQKDPTRFAGSVDALVALVREIRNRFPTLVLFVNNGLEHLDQYGDAIHGVLVEDLYTRYDAAKQEYLPTEAALQTSKEALLDAFRVAHPKSRVLTIIYATSSMDPIAKPAMQRARAKGYDWYIGTVDLMRIGYLQPR